VHINWLIAFVAPLVAVAIWGIVIERSIYIVRKESIKVLPIGSKPITVLQIGDIHMAPWQKSKQRFIQSLAKLPIDLVVNTGDNLGHQKAIPSLLQALEPLLAKPGVFVNGSNDYFGPVMKNPFGYIFHTSHAPNSERLDTAKMTNAFEQSGWVDLNNKTSQLVVSGNKIRFIGLDDFHIGYSDSSKLSESPDFTIALTHAPYLEVVETLTKLGAELIFAGHTHGGQVRIPFLGALTTNSDLPNKYARGLSGWNFDGKKSILSVVAGLGNSIFAPVRFACFPEVRLITLQERD
jgi:predicted MPP superfamily phosphohydrolase